MREGDTHDEEMAAGMDEAERRAEEAVRSARRKFEGAYDRTAKVAGKAYRDAIDFAYEKPAMAALVTFGAGLTMGYLLSGSKTRNYRGRVVPALATALADAVYEVFDGH
jgi:ElaB/YqjD/DUF883 family membrane-anchored ribosome-binding protein